MNFVEFPQSDVLVALNKFAPNAMLLPVDSKYRALTEEDWKFAISKHGRPHWPYEPEWRDCNHFAMRFKTDMTDAYECNGVGFVIDYPGKHSFNLLLVVNSDKTLRIEIFEPQTDAEVKFGTKHYDLKKGTFVIV